MSKYLDELRTLAKTRFNCPDIYSKWEGYFIDDILYGKSNLEDTLKAAIDLLTIAIKRDKEVQS